MTRNRRKTLVIVAMLCLVAVACGDQAETEPENTLTPAAGLKTIVRGTLTIGTDMPYAPFESLDNRGNPVGFDVELANEVARRLGLRTTYYNAVFDTIFTALGTGTKWDLVVSAVTGYAPAGSPAAETVGTRAKIVSFSKPYYSSLQSLAINKARTPDIKTTADLKSGDRVGVQTGTTGAFWAEKNLESTGVVIVGFSKAPDMFLALDAGRVKGVVNDLPVSLEAVEGKADLAVVQQIETGEQYAFALAKDNTALRDAVDAQLTAIFDDGTYVRIFKKYFPDQELPTYVKGATPSP